LPVAGRRTVRHAEGVFVNRSRRGDEKDNFGAESVGKMVGWRRKSERREGCATKRQRRSVRQLFES
jgi:hypothetical protein